MVSGFIASTAGADKNRLDTGTLGFSDIGNRADYKVEHLGGSFSTGGPVGSQVLGNMASSLLSGLGAGGHAEGVTRAAVSDGTLIVRDQAAQKQDVSTLSHDTAGANGSISPIFDKEKEQKRLQTAQLVGEIAAQAMDVARTEGEIRAITAGKAELAKKNIPEPAAGDTREAWDAYNEKLQNSSAYRDTQAEWGTGSDIQRGIQAATAVVQGLLAGSVQGAAAGAAAPYLAGLIHKETTTSVNGNIQEVNEPANLIAHAVLGAVVAQLQGKNALAGAAGATTGEFIAQRLYPGVEHGKLSEEQKQKISALSTLAAGLAGSLASGDMSGTVAGASAGKNAVENNALNVQENQSRVQEMSQCQGNKACEGTVTEKYKQISAAQQKRVVKCTGARDCVDKANEVGRLQADYANRTNELLEKARVNGGLSPADQNELSILQVTTIQLEADRNAAIHNALMSGDSSEAKQLAINLLAQVAGTSAAGIAAGIGKGSGAKERTATGQSSTIVPGGGLAAHEKAGGHLVDRHVGKTEAELFDRVSTGNTKTASTFTDRATAEAVTSKVIDSNHSKIQSYLSGSQKGYLELDYESSAAIGISVTRGATSAVPATNARIIIGRDPSMPDGYKIITGYPTP